MWNGTMFVDLDWPLNASSLLSASAELLVYQSGSPIILVSWSCPVCPPQFQGNPVSGALNTRGWENLRFLTNYRLLWKWYEIGRWETIWRVICANYPAGSVSRFHQTCISPATSPSPIQVHWLQVQIQVINCSNVWHCASGTGFGIGKSMC